MPHSEGFTEQPLPWDVLLDEVMLPRVVLHNEELEPTALWCPALPQSSEVRTQFSTESPFR